MDAPNPPAPVPLVPCVGRCESYRPGHQTHWIMVNRYRSAPRTAAVIRSVQGTAITVDVGGERRLWHHHEPERLLAAVGGVPGRVRVILECTAVLVDLGGETYWFYCSPRPLGPCSFPANG